MSWPGLTTLAVMIPSLAFTQADLSISTAHGSEREIRTREQLLGILDRFDLTQWTITTVVVVDETAIPHSHPVLTVHTRHRRDEHLLSTYIHEQLHWYLEDLQEETRAAIADLRVLYPDVPVGGLEGARDEESTYLHLIVNYLELQAMKQVLGGRLANEVFRFWETDHYTWIYARVLADESKIGAIVEAHGLSN